jgi:hypothetical protein
MILNQLQTRAAIRAFTIVEIDVGTKKFLSIRIEIV